jgi:hypothetical protein
MDELDKIYKKEVLYKAVNMDTVIVRENIIYPLDTNRQFMMDLYTSHPNISMPTVILIHGEAKSVNNMKNAGQYCSWGKIIAASGLNAVTFNHRTLSDGFSISDVIQDIDDLLQYVISNAYSLGINKNRIALWSFSGGVTFGMYAGLSGYFDSIKCIISYYGFGDFDYINQFFTAQINNNGIKEISLLNLVKKNAALIPPIFIARAGLDNKLINESIDRFILEALQNNLTVDLFNHATGQHAFDLFNDNDRTREIIHKSLDFLKTHLD